MSIQIQELPTATELSQDKEIRKIMEKPIVEWNGVRAHLSHQERTVWLLLNFRRGSIIPTEQLEASMYRIVKTRSNKETQKLVLRVVICNIRRKLKAKIVAIYRLGYVLDPEKL